MKTIATKKIIVILFFLFVGSGIQSTQAQFFKKLAKKAEEKIEREAENRAQRRVDKKIDDAFDEAEDTVDGKNKKDRKNKKNKTDKNSAEPSKNQEPNILQTNDDIDLPANYSFDWKYVIKIESDQLKNKRKDINDMKMVYYLKLNATHIAIKPDIGAKSSEGNMLMVMDTEADVSLMLMDVNGQKMRMTIPSQKIEDAIEGEANKNYKVVKIDSKVLLGYKCQGFRIETDEATVISYIAKNPPISFNGIFKGDSKFKPKGFDPRWLKEFENGLILEMQYTSKKKKKENVKMTCIELKKEPFSINMSAYKPFGSE